ncbi:hypothetical protein FB45DRAFT_1004994 [Roridomyces roridus]|uniref:F-box domain-containing protein n=1 Tax=Roridomyces roridus TaxID=1738132 RepID=A0AAD7BMK0_9AGAR|nr:hypothetical protein FB45DRAFT_1004994 [Roridomyces roridus]
MALHSERPLFPSPLSSTFLETNDAPVESQIPSVRDFISRARTQKTRLAEEIAQLQSRLNVLYLEHDELDAQILQHEGVLSPLRRFPTEILSLIFTFAFTRDPTRSFKQDLEPWIVSAVCARWRAVVLLSPTFWTTINSYDSHFTLSNLTTQLSRSGNLPLTLHFTYEVNNSAAFHLLLQHCARWKTIHLTISQELYSSIQRTSPHFPVLRKVKLEIHFDGIHSGFSDVFSNAPELEDFFVDGYPYSSTIALDLPWPQLTKYSSANQEWGQLSTLASAVHLVECTLDMSEEEKPANLDIPVMLFPTLLRLSVSHHTLLAYFQAPVLAELYCHSYEYRSALDEHALLRWLPRTLRRLVLESPDRDMVPSPYLDLISIVQALPKLEALGCFDPCSLDNISRFLGSAAARSPALERLSIVIQIGTAGLFEILEAVDWENVRLRKLVFQLSGTKPILVPESLRDRGVELQGSAGLFYDSLVPENLRLKR